MSDLPTQADFDAMYSGTAPWDIGHPQGSLRAIADAGGIRGRVLDAGCGTGVHALMGAGSQLQPRANPGLAGDDRAPSLNRMTACFALSARLSLLRASPVAPTTRLISLSRPRGGARTTAGTIRRQIGTSSWSTSSSASHSSASRGPS